MSKKESLLEDALLSMKNLEEVVTENAKGILASTMKEEISQLVKESLEEEMEEEMEEKVKEEGSYSEGEVEEAEHSEEDEPIKEEDEDMEDEEGLEDMMDDMEGEEPEMEDMMGDEDESEDMEIDANPEFGDEEEDFDSLMDVMGDEEGDEIVDITNMTRDEAIKVFKLLNADDDVVVKKDDDSITLTDDEEDTEYIIKLDESEEMEEGMDMEEGDYKEEEMEEGMDMEEGNYKEEEMEEGECAEGDCAEGDDIVYEIELDEEDEESHEEEEEDEEEEANEAARTLGNGSRNHPARKRKGLPKMKVKPLGESKSLKEEVKTLKAKNEEYKKALDVFRTKLNEVAVFNSNLAYATRLFTEHSTTKKEKVNILKRFDNVETLKESKVLYKTIKDELNTSQSMVNESVAQKVQKTPQKGSTNLIESKTYENEQFLRMKDIMKKIIK